MLEVARCELILGGQKSGKSRRAEALAGAWLRNSPGHEAVLVATALAHDAEMGARIQRHRQDRAERVPGLCTVEEPLALAAVLLQYSRANTLVVVDCLTLWLTNLLMPVNGDAADPSGPVHELCVAIQDAPGPVVLVGNEIGLGVIPLGREVRAFVDALGLLNQAVAASASRVTLMVAGMPLALKEPA